MAMHREAWIAQADKVFGPGGDHGGSEAHWAAFAGDIDSLRELDHVYSRKQMIMVWHRPTGQRSATGSQRFNIYTHWYQELWKPRVNMARHRPTTQHNATACQR